MLHFTDANVSVFLLVSINIDRSEKIVCTRTLVIMFKYAYSYDMQKFYKNGHAYCIDSYMPPYSTPRARVFIRAYLHTDILYIFTENTHTYATPPHIGVLKNARTSVHYSCVHSITLSCNFAYTHTHTHWPCTSAPTTTTLSLLLPVLFFPLSPSLSFSSGWGWVAGGIYIYVAAHTSLAKLT